MALTARTYNNNTDIGSENDIVGAFNQQGECVGLAEASEVPAFLGGGHAFLVQIYSHEPNGDEIEFKYYNTEMDTVYNISETLFFESDAIVGDIFSPFILSIIEQQNENMPPNAESAAYTLDEDNMITIYLSATDEDGDVLTLEIQGDPNNGIVMLSGVVATYYPNANYNGEDSFSFIASDGQENSNIASIDLIINAVNDAPYLYPIPDAAVNSGELFVYELEAVDVDGDDLIYTTTVSGGSVTTSIEENVLTLVSQESNITLAVVVTVSDGNATHSVSFILTVLEQQQTTCLDNNVDGWCDNFPVISIIDGNATMLMQGSSENYVDSGAFCSDQEDGDISHQVEVSGDIININIPGTYMISYSCSDSDGNVAQIQHRTVFIIPPTIADINEDGFDDDAFMAGAQSGDANLDGTLNVIDVVIFINTILNGE